jgi:hypothetical protein
MGTRTFVSMTDIHWVVFVCMFEEIILALSCTPEKNASNILMECDCLVTFSLHQDMENEFAKGSEKIVL